MRGASFGRLTGMALAIPVFILLGLAARAGAMLPPAGGATVSPTPLPTSMRPPLIIPDLGPNATQADYGERAYRLVCAACHGNRGQGLTDEWRAQWPPEDQNCWQSKCHAPNHPPDGFIVPRYVPPVLGPNTLLRFGTALDLHDYIYQAMPWQEPASLSVKEYWDITAYLVRERGVDPIREPLDAARAATLRLHPEATPASEPPAPHTSLPIGLLVAVAAVGLGLGAGLWLVWRRARRSRD
jgi:mono/diheme cytochrome c family protein